LFDLLSFIVWSLHCFYGPWSYSSWIYNYVCNHCLSALKLWVRIPRGVLYTTLCNKVWQWLTAGRWFSPGTPGSSINKTDRHDITEILLKVSLNTITLTGNHLHSLWFFNWQLPIVAPFGIVRLFSHFPMFDPRLNSNLNCYNTTSLQICDWLFSFNEFNLLIKFKIVLNAEAFQIFKGEIKSLRSNI